MTHLLLILSIAALVLACVALASGLNAQSMALRALQLATKTRSPAQLEKLRAESGAVWVILNPTKIEDLPQFKQVITSLCSTAAYPEPKFVQTTVESPGQEQAREAARQGAQLVLVAGGDGTVREVAAGLSASKTSLGIIPLGTGNLMARNLNLPLDSIVKAGELALTGRDTWIDLGYLQVEGEKRYPFLVMAGIGFDGDIMKGANSNLKESIGWGAYFLSGMAASVRPASHVEVKLGEEKTVRREKVHTLLFASCGELVGGIPLLPDANPSDGWLDVLFLGVRGWVFGWAELIGRVLSNAFSRKQRAPGIASKLHVVRARTATAKVLDGPREVQVDGDPIGEHSELTVELKHHALKVRIA